MASLGDVFAVINSAKQANIITDYAIGGAMAVLFYAEPTRTYDLDVFILQSQKTIGQLISITSIYEWAQSNNYAFDAEHIIIHGVPVQFLPAHNLIAEEAIHQARDLDYEGVPVRVIAPEHLIALALDAGGAKRRERIAYLLEAKVVDYEHLNEILLKYNLEAPWRRYLEFINHE
ncbi:MAG: nucleotidyltransferase [Deltaproteobacteria bacterium]|nr:nucleotidyltransferase [Deltaproteobacteria bacterium]